PTAVFAFLKDELSAPLLDELYNQLWLVARKSGQSINPLHKKKWKGNFATEGAGLHLVWHRAKIYIKPMPRCLLSHDFWITCLLSGGSASSSSGFGPSIGT
ncbi:hypothetical protein K469DRAFT_574422, partial [Zopfia rhizophila CBS 207.26]